jgi:prepilin-type N-terminal cleavage/methylation domain-containing protein
MVMKFHRQRGFTLIEVAVVVLLLGIAMTLGLKMLNARLDHSAYSETKANQERIKMALIAFLRTNGRLPCPDNATPPTGFESAPCSGDDSGDGVVPWATLGLTRDAALDGWGNFFTYRVSNTRAQLGPTIAGVPHAQGPNQNWTTRSDQDEDSFDINSLRSPTDGQYISIQIDERPSGAVNPVPIAYNAVVVIYSHGKNGFGAKTVKGTSIATPPAFTSVYLDERDNNAPNARRFIIRGVTDNVAAPGGPYDDIVTYMTPQDLLQPLINEGTLKACYSYCSCNQTPGEPPCQKSDCSASGIPIGKSSIICK